MTTAKLDLILGTMMMWCVTVLVHVHFLGFGENLDSLLYPALHGEDKKRTRKAQMMQHKCPALNPKS